MASLVHLVRHGEVDNPDHLVYASLPGFTLSETGRAQAARTTRHLGSQPVVAVWSSPLERALATAAVIAGRFGVPVRVEADLTEWRLLDRWAGTRWEEVDDLFPGELVAYLEHPTALAFAPESLAQLAVRTRRVIERVATRYPEGDVVIVGHQDPIQAARLVLTGGDLTGLHLDKPGHGTVFTFRPGGTWTEVSAFTP
jgi:broad specificity phosphatase PhoE